MRHATSDVPNFTSATRSLASFHWPEAEAGAWACGVSGSTRQQNQRGVQRLHPWVMMGQRETPCTCRTLLSTDARWRRIEANLHACQSVFVFVLNPLFFKSMIIDYFSSTQLQGYLIQVFLTKCTAISSPQHCNGCLLPDQRSCWSYELANEKKTTR